MSKQVCEEFAEHNDYIPALKSNHSIPEQKVNDFFEYPAENSRRQISLTKDTAE